MLLAFCWWFASFGGCQWPGAFLEFLCLFSSCPRVEDRAVFMKWILYLMCSILAIVLEPQNNLAWWKVGQRSLVGKLMRFSHPEVWFQSPASLRGREPPVVVPSHIQRVWNRSVFLILARRLRDPCPWYYCNLRIFYKKQVEQSLHANLKLFNKYYLCARCQIRTPHLWHLPVSLTPVSLTPVSLTPVSLTYPCLLSMCCCKLSF